MDKYKPLELIRGVNVRTGHDGPYQSIEWVPFKDMLGFGENPGAAARNANAAAYYNAGLLPIDGEGYVRALTDQEVIALTSSGRLVLDGREIESWRSRNPDLPFGRVAATEAFCQRLGLGVPLWTLYGNPTVLTVFFPDINLPDRQVDIVEVGRRAPWRVENADDFLRSPSLFIQGAAYELQEFAGLEGIAAKVPFSWDAVNASKTSPS